MPIFSNPKNKTIHVTISSPDLSASDFNTVPTETKSSTRRVTMSSPYLRASDFDNVATVLEIMPIK